MEWMLTAMACWRMGLTVVTIYATLGAEGALHGVTQAGQGGDRRRQTPQGVCS